MTFRRKVCMVVLSVCASACSQNTPPPEPAAFSRPTRVAFVCVDKNRTADDPNHLVSLSHCDTHTVQAIETPPDAGTASYALHTLVTQSSRGEVAAVEIGARHIIDNRPDIPGATFLPTGEVPVAISVADDYPHTMYVANAGSRDISVLRTDALFALQGAESFRKQRVPLMISDSDAPAVPFDMIMSPDQDALFVSSTDAGWVVRIPIKHCAKKASGNASDAGMDAGIDAGAQSADDTCEEGLLDTTRIQRIPVEESWSKLSASAFQPQPTEDEPYRFVCPPRPADTKDLIPERPSLLPIPDAPIALPQPTADVGKPQPAGLALDAFCARGDCTRRLLVADRQQPIVHAINLDMLGDNADPSGAVMAPILSGAPTERVAVTPRVPVRVREEAAGTMDAASAETSTQYVYAIDARDGSVLVAQHDRVRNVTVDPSKRADRLDLGIALAGGQPVAMSLAVMTPAFDPRGNPEQWVNRPTSAPAADDPLLCVDPDHQTRTVRRLRGVYLAVGATDGTVRIITVHDMELKNCRGSEPKPDGSAPDGCQPDGNNSVPSYSPYIAGYDPYPVVRNRARIAYDYSTSSSESLQPLHPTVLPGFVVEGANIGIKDDGSTNDTRVAGLDCVACDGTFAVSYPPPSQGQGTSTTDTTSSVPDGGVADAGSTVTDDGLTGDVCGAKEGRVCSMADPFVEPVNWTAEYEGLIPGTRGGRGRFVDPSGSQSGEVELTAEIDFCQAGVLGNDELGYAKHPDAGDQLLIVSALPTDQLRTEVPDTGDVPDRDLCNALITARDTDNGAIAFGIKKAYANRLVLEPKLQISSAKQPPADWTKVRACFANQPMMYEVHTRKSFLVGSRLGFQHRVMEAPGTRHCQIDPTQDVKHTSRARLGERFDNGLIAFQPRDGVFQRLTVLQLVVQTNSLKLALNASDVGGGTVVRGVMPVDVRFNPGDETMYVVDITLRGLLPITLDPMPTLPLFSIQ